MSFKINRNDWFFHKTENIVDNVISQNVSPEVLKPTEASNLAGSIMDYIIDPNAQNNNPFTRADKHLEEMISSAVEKSSNMKETMGSKPSFGLDKQNSVSNCEQELETAENDFDTADNNYNNSQNTVNKADSSVSNQENVVAQAETGVNNQQDVVDTDQKNVDTAQNTVNESQETVDTNQTSVDNANTEVTTASTNVETAQSTVTETSSAVSDAQAELETAQSEAAAAQSSTSTSETESSTSTQSTQATQAQQKVEEAQQKLEEAQQENEEAEEKLNTEQETLTNAQNTLTEAQDTLSESQETLEQNQTELESTQETLTNSQEELQTCQNTLEDENTTLKTEQSELETAQTDLKTDKEELNTAQTKVDKAETNVEKAEDKQEEKPYQIAENIENIISNGTQEELQNELKKLTPENISGIADAIGSPWNLHTDKTAVTASQEEYYKSINENNKIVYDTYLKKAEKYGVDVSDIPLQKYSDKEEEDGMLDSGIALANRIDAANAKYNANVVFNNDVTQNLKDAVDAKISEGNIDKFENTEQIDLGNGKIDKQATQMAGNCWLHAGLSSIASTEKGKECLEKQIYRDSEHGITAVHIQEAENGKYGYNGTGIYTMTDEEIAKGANESSSGDGDVTAYTLAVQKYFNEKYERESANADDGTTVKKESVYRGNYCARAYELFSGQSNGSGVYDSEWKTCGITSDVCSDSRFVSLSDTDNFAQIYNLAKTSSGATCLSVASSGKTQEVIAGGGHAVSVVGVNGDNLLVTESNNSGHLLNGLQKSDVTVNGSPTWILSREEYEARFRQHISYIWD